MRAIPLENIPQPAKIRAHLYEGTALDTAAATQTLRAWHANEAVASGPTTVGRLHLPEAEQAALAELRQAYGPSVPRHHTFDEDPNFARLNPLQRRAITMSDLALRYAVLLDARRSGLTPTDEHDLSRVAAGQYQAADRNLGWHVDGRWRVANRYPGFTAVRYNVVLGEVDGTEFAVGRTQLSNIDTTGEDTLVPGAVPGQNPDLTVQSSQPGDIQRWLAEVDGHREPPVGEGARMLITDSNLLQVWY